MNDRELVAGVEGCTLGGADCPDWSAFGAANPDLLAWKPSILERYYTAPTLA